MPKTYERCPDGNCEIDGLDWYPRDVPEADQFFTCKNDEQNPCTPPEDEDSTGCRCYVVLTHIKVDVDAGTNELMEDQRFFTPGFRLPGPVIGGLSRREWEHDFNGGQWFGPGQNEIWVKGCRCLKVGGKPQGPVWKND